MDTKMIPADVALLRVLEAWHVKDVFGYPAGSLNSLMNALDQERERIHFIQVRHEQVGALAASAQAKFTHRLGVAFGSAGPGAVNMLNGLYDAKEDHVPVLAIVGQTNSYDLNYDYFQEFPEAPIFNDVACYDRIVMNPRSLPHVADRAIRTAYHYHGVAVIVIPNDMGFVNIPARRYASAPVTELSIPKISVRRSQVKSCLKLIRKARRPVFHVGIQIHNAGKQLVKLAKRLQIPIIADGLAKRLVPAHVATIGTGNRITSKAANEIMDTTDLVISLGSEFALSHRFYESRPFKYIQIDRHRERLGYHHSLDLGIWTDPDRFVEQLLKTSHPVSHRPYYQAVIADINNEIEYQHHLAVQATDPMHPAQVYRQINRIAKPNAVFSVDIGDNTVNSFRYLALTRRNRFLLSAHFATMGCSLPGAIAAQLTDPERQVFSIAGDGAISMVMQDLVTERKYHLPIINVVTTNNTTNYIKSQQADLAMKAFGVTLTGQNFKLIANGMGIPAINVTNSQALQPAFDRARGISDHGRPVLINVMISSQRSLPVEKLHVNYQGGTWSESVDGHQSLRQFFDHYRGQGLKSLSTFMDQVAKSRH